MVFRAACHREWNKGKTAMADMFTILVADRSPAIRNQFQRRAGQGNSFALVEAEEIGACNKLLEQGGIDLAFVDIALIGAGESEEFAAGIARRKNLVALMADPDKEGIFAFAESLKAFDFLIKPFSPEDVDAVIATCRRLSAPIKALIVDPRRRCAKSSQNPDRQRLSHGDRRGRKDAAALRPVRAQTLRSHFPRLCGPGHDRARNAAAPDRALAGDEGGDDVG